MKRYTGKIFEEVNVERGILFAQAEGYDTAHTPTDLHMDVYSPAGDDDKARRGVILVHGGGFLNGDRMQNYIVILGNLLAQYGYVCFAVDYRLFEKENRPSYATSAPYAAADIETARRYIAANAERFGIDAEKMYICGGSAGGMASVEACRLYSEYRAFICLWGAYPDVRVPAKYPPTILIHGTADKSVPFPLGEEFHERLAARGIPTELIPLADAPHTCINRLPDFEERMIAFLEEHA